MVGCQNAFRTTLQRLNAPRFGGTGQGGCRFRPSGAAAVSTRRHHPGDAETRRAAGRAKLMSGFGPPSPVQCYAMPCIANHTCPARCRGRCGVAWLAVTSRPLIIYTPPSGKPSQNGHAQVGSRKRFEHGPKKVAQRLGGREPKRKPKCSRGTHQGVGARR